MTTSSPRKSSSRHAAREPHVRPVGRIGYVVFLEPLWANVLATQVIDVLEEMSRVSGEPRTLIWFYRPDWLIRNREQIRAIEDRLARNGVRVLKFPVLSKDRMVNWWIDLLGVLQALVWLVIVRSVHDVDLLHVRSYPPALAASLLKRLGGNVSILFDPRSPAPEEQVAAGHWSQGSWSFRLWKDAERDVLRQADGVVCTTEAMETDLKSVLEPDDGDRRWAVIPNNYQPSPGAEDAAATPAHDDRAQPTICYMGSLSNTSWNNVETYAAFAKKILAERPTWKFLFVVPAVDRRSTTDYFRKAGLADLAESVRSVHPHQVQSVLAGCTVGIQIMKHRDNRMGIKVAEYLGAGLPIVASDTVLGAVEIIESHGVGFVLENNDANLDEAIAYIEHASHRRAELRRICMQTAEENFTTHAVSKRYLDFYDALPRPT